VSLRQCTQHELDDRAQRAEQQMNHALESRRWNLVRRYREEMLAVATEWERRVRELDELAESAA
jgi:predicted nucleic acid-binding protein